MPEPKHKQNKIIYNILMHHINHYQEVKKIFKIDYDSHMILIAVYAHFLYATLNPSLEKNFNLSLEWNEMFSAIESLSNKKMYNKKLSIFSVSQILAMPKESVRRKVNLLCKKKYLSYSVNVGLSMGENYEAPVRQIAPKDMSALAKVIKSLEENGGIDSLLKSVK